MATLGDLFKDIAISIRKKGGSIDKMTAMNFPNKILSIPIEDFTPIIYKKATYDNKIDEIDVLKLISEENNEHSLVCYYNDKKQIEKVLYNGDSIDVEYSPNGDLIRIGDTEIDLTHCPLSGRDAPVKMRLEKIVSTKIMIEKKADIKALMSLYQRKINLSGKIEKGEIITVSSDEINLSKCNIYLSKEKERRVAHTSNYDDNGFLIADTYNFNEKHTQVISFLTAPITLNIKWDVEDYDDIYVFKGNHPDYDRNSEGYLERLRKSGEKEIFIDDEAVTIVFWSDGSINRKGYYAYVDNFVPFVKLSSLEYEAQGDENFLCGLITPKEGNKEYYFSTRTNTIL